MKTICFTLVFLTATPVFAAGGSSSAGLPAPAAADSRETAILDHPVITGLAHLLNEKYGNKCTVPAGPGDIQWRCLGALPEVRSPMIYPSSCFFSVTIACPSESARIDGVTISYGLLTSSGFDQSVKRTDDLVVINGVTFESAAARR